MLIEEKLKELENRKHELIFKQIEKNETEKHDLMVRDESGIIPLYFRPIDIEEAKQRVEQKKPIIFIKRDSKLGTQYLKECNENS